MNAPSLPTTDAVDEPAFFDRFRPYRWQVEALSAWLRVGRRGVVEAVTGSGKTDMAFAAIADARRRGLFICVIVPSRVLLEQWYQRMTIAFPDDRIGRLGDHHLDHAEDVDILITTRHSAASRKPVPGDDRQGLLVADECHGYGGKVLRKSLMTDYDERLGLTATLERSDDAVEEVILPYFGGICFRYGFVDAIADGVCAQPRVAFVAVPLTDQERSEYTRTERTLVEARTSLKKIDGMPTEPFGAFLAAVQHLAQNDGGPNGKAANDYLDAFALRRDIVADSEAKFETLTKLAPSIRAADGSLLFTETVRASNHAINRLDPVVSIEIITGETPRTDRERILTTFRAGELDAVAAPRVLDEGIDVPDANLGIVVSASRTRRQMIQRMGRILRRKQAGAGAKFVIVFAADTLEDPRSAVDRDGFVEEIEEIAEAMAVFGVDELDRLTDFLDWSGPEVVAAPSHVGPFDAASDADVDAVLHADEATAYAMVHAVPWVGERPAFDDVELPERPESAEPEYLPPEMPDLPSIETEKKRKEPPKRLSTGEAPVMLEKTRDGFVLRCTGCGTTSNTMRFRWEATDATVECDCRAA